MSRHDCRACPERGCLAFFTLPVAEMQKDLDVYLNFDPLSALNAGPPRVREGECFFFETPFSIGFKGFKEKIF